MNSEQYVESVKQMMNQQNVFFSIFLAILAIVLTFVGVIQWRLSSKQIELIKQQTKEETEKEIAQKLGVDEISTFPQKIEVIRKNENTRIEKKLDELINALVKKDTESIRLESLRLELDLNEVPTKENQLYYFLKILELYSSVMKQDIAVLNSFVNRLIYWINEKKETEAGGIPDEVKFTMHQILWMLRVIESDSENSSGSNLPELEKKLEESGFI